MNGLLELCFATTSIHLHVHMGPEGQRKVQCIRRACSRFASLQYVFIRMFISDQNVKGNTALVAISITHRYQPVDTVSVKLMITSSSRSSGERKES